MLCHVVWDGMSDRVDSRSQIPRICICYIDNAHVGYEGVFPPPRKSALHKAKGLCTYQRLQDIISPYCVSALPMLLRRPSASA